MRCDVLPLLSGYPLIVRKWSTRQKISGLATVQFHIPGTEGLEYAYIIFMYIVTHKKIKAFGDVDLHSSNRAGLLDGIFLPPLYGSLRVI